MGVFAQRVLVGVAAAIAGACSSGSPFVCAGDEDCKSGGMNGRCEASHYCSFPDEACPTGRRYGALAPTDYANMCVPEDDIAEGSSGVGSVGDASLSGSSGDGSGSTTFDPTTTTTSPLTQADDSLSDTTPPQESSSGSVEESTTTDPSDGGNESSSSGSMAESETTGGPPLECAEGDLGNMVGEDLASDITDDGYDLVHPSCSFMDALDMSYLWVAPYDGRFAFSILDADYDAVLAIEDIACDGAELACNDDFLGLGSAIALDLVTDQALRITIDSANVDMGWFALDIEDVGNFDCAEADLGSATGMVAMGNNMADGDTWHSNCAGDGGQDFVWRWTSPATGWYTFSTVGSTYDTVLGLFWPGCSADEATCSDDDVDVAAEFSAPVTEGETILILLDAYAAEDVGDYVLTITAN